MGKILWRSLIAYNSRTVIDIDLISSQYRPILLTRFFETGGEDFGRGQNFTKTGFVRMPGCSMRMRELQVYSINWVG